MSYESKIEANEVVLMELPETEIDAVSGGAIPLVVWGIGAIIAGGGAGVGLGYLVNK